MFLVGLGLLLGGGQFLVRGAAAIAQGFGVPPIAVGLTVVAFGTSAPEFFVAVVASASGAHGVGFGNLVGANVVNIGFILGLSALIIPLSVHPTIVTREIPMLLLAMFVVLALSLDNVFGAGPNRLERGDGVVLCLLFCVFLYYTVMALRRTEPARDPFVTQAAEAGWRMRTRAMATPVLMVLGGLAALAFGGNALVDSAVAIAKSLGMTPAIIGLTVVAVGTTMPELITSLIAVYKGEGDLAVGNVVGSNLFNILCILGVATAISPISIPEVGPSVLLVATALPVLLLILVFTHQRHIIRAEGALLLAIFLGYMAWLAIAALPD